VLSGRDAPKLFWAPTSFSLISVSRPPKSFPAHGTLTDGAGGFLPGALLGCLGMASQRWPVAASSDHEKPLIRRDRVRLRSQGPYPRAPEKSLPFAIEALEGPLELVPHELSPEGLKTYRPAKRAVFVNSSVDVGRIALKPCLP